ncbi:DUF6020 family protein [Zhenhengia sp.]|uniref:DUF6020 family protein n=1 Tax=Zhenhengia sp. TaxID=2944208 RepID=UPI00307920B7
MMKNRIVKIIVISMLAILSGLIYYAPSAWNAEKNHLTIEVLNDRNDQSGGNEVWIREIQVDGRAVNLRKYGSEKWEYKYGQLVAYKIIPTIFEEDFNVEKSLKITFLNHPLSGKVKITWNDESSIYDLYNIEDINQELELIPKQVGTVDLKQDILVYSIIIFTYLMLYLALYKTTNTSIRVLLFNIICTHLATYMMVDLLNMRNIFEIILLNSIMLLSIFYLDNKIHISSIRNKELLKPIYVFYNFILVTLLLISIRFNNFVSNVTDIGVIIIFISSIIIGIWIFTYLEQILIDLRYKRNKETEKYNDKKILRNTTFSLVVVNAIYLISFYPGFMTSDSIDQWGQMLSKTFYDAHPVAHTLFNLICTSIWKSPAAVSLVQIIIFILICRYAIRIMLDMEIDKRLIYLAVSIYLISPVFPLMNITLWKDIMYSNMVFLFTLLYIRIYVSDFEWLKRKLNLIAFLMVGLGVLMFRHNGLSVIVATLVLSLVLYIRKWKVIAVAYGILLISFYIIIGPIYSLLGIESSLLKKDESIARDLINYHTIAYIIKNGGDIKENEIELIEKVVNIEEINVRYSKYHTLNFSSLEINESYILENLDLYKQLYSDITGRNKTMVIDNFMNTRSYLWELIQPDDAYLNLAPVNTIYPNEYGLELKPVHKNLNRVLTSYFEISAHNLLINIFWRPVISIFILIVLAIIMIYKFGYKALITLVPVMGNWAGIFLTVSFQDFRYMYSIFLVVPIIMAMTLGKEKTTRIKERI